MKNLNELRGKKSDVLGLDASGISENGDVFSTPKMDDGSAVKKSPQRSLPSLPVMTAADTDTSITSVSPKPNQRQVAPVESDEDMRAVGSEQMGVDFQRIFSGIIEKFEREISAAFNQLQECEFSPKAKSESARGAMKGVHKAVKAVQKACFPKSRKKKQSDSTLTSEASSHQPRASETARANAGAVRPAHTIKSFAEAVTAPRSVRQQRSNVAPLAPEGLSAPEALRGEVVGVNYANEYAFIRTPHHKTDFHVGPRQFLSDMKVGDEVSFECENASRPSRNRCPEASDVKFIRGATHQDRAVNLPHARNKGRNDNSGRIARPVQPVRTAQPARGAQSKSSYGSSSSANGNAGPARDVQSRRNARLSRDAQPLPSNGSFSTAQKVELMEMLRDAMSHFTGTASRQA